MNKSDIISSLKAHVVDLPEVDTLARMRAVASAPESLVAGPDVGLVLPNTEDEQLTSVTPLLRKAIRELADAYDADVELEKGAERVADLRAEIAAQGLDGFVVPMADEYQNEYVPRHAKRLAWLSGFGGSAGTIVVLADKAAIFVDGRYTLQVRDQVDV